MRVIRTAAVHALQAYKPMIANRLFSSASKFKVSTKGICNASRRHQKSTFLPHHFRGRWGGCPTRAGVPERNQRLHFQMQAKRVGCVYPSYIFCLGLSLVKTASPTSLPKYGCAIELYKPIARSSLQLAAYHRLIIQFGGSKPEVTKYLRFLDTEQVNVC